MHDPFEIKFKVDRFTPSSIPIDRLGAYASAFAKLLGSKKSIPFGGLERGSTVFVAKVPVEELELVDNNLLDAGASGTSNPAFKELNELLLQDETTGSILNHRGESVISFPGIKTPKPPVFPNFREDSSVDGQLVRIGGTDETVHATLLHGEERSRLSMDRTTAMELAKYLFGPTIRFRGSARYKKEPDTGIWTVLQFDVQSFEVLEEVTLREEVARLRAEGSFGLVGEEAFARVSGERDEEQRH